MGGWGELTVKSMSEKKNSLKTVSEIRAFGDIKKQKEFTPS